MLIKVEVSDIPFDPACALSEFNQDMHQAGAIVSFSGHVRPKVGNENVNALIIQSYSPMTERKIKAVANLTAQRWPLLGVYIIHRTGQIEPKEAIVFVATASDHRRSAFEAADYLMDYLKTEAILWKKEVTEMSSYWVEPSVQDYIDMDRWSKP